ncbi:MAG: very short patch repair endonuclease [Caulobacteraceae bacterium]
MDDLTPEQRRKNMQSIKSKETKIEIILRKALWAKGFRYRKNYKKLIGTPDIVFTKQKVAIFCDSEFWHGYDFESFIKRIDTNKDYWIKKIRRNIERDKEVTELLEHDGWIVLRFWGNQIRKETEQCLSLIEETLRKRGMQNNGKHQK